ncbi:glutamate--cysteine ligase [Pantoea sp. Aalb]|uniref:glutamate--cysteine ligase n=1 Tax=Pantoea sp. Aalb TaxID=2576762 RepID=UPI001328E79D|nr:glutamate--cysteine ligase [Pantoea sp. Aalb]MXP67772.1 glutamate--cysteine ligase [Pantoea sp. Aalb]
MLYQNKLFVNRKNNIIPDMSKGLSWLETHANTLKNINRGIERETLRVNLDGHLATTNHPKSFGSALKHTCITTDFAEALLEFITPVDQNINRIFVLLRDIHRYVTRTIDHERLWPFSMPCIIDDINNIQLAQYGSSNIGKMKMLYREGLKNRYGVPMQLISGVHYNFSLPLLFWQKWADISDVESGKKVISSGYLHLIRNYYRFGWIIPYLFGSSPAICSSFLQERKSHLQFKTNGHGTMWLPYATSLRLSNFGYTNTLQSNLPITFNSLEEYVSALKIATKTPSKKYQAMGIKDIHGNRLQLNTNVLQIENELYTPIRPKRVSRVGESLSDSLLYNGIEYIEVRSLDINPFSVIGINIDEINFLDLFLIWCILADSPEMSTNELTCIRKTWNRIVLEGRKPDQIIIFGCQENEYKLLEIVEALFADLYRIAKILDRSHAITHYQHLCKQLFKSFKDPELTYSARILQLIKKNGLIETGMSLSNKYYSLLFKEPLEIFTNDDFTRQAHESIIAQKILEIKDRFNSIK